MLTDTAVPFSSASPAWDQLQQTFMLKASKPFRHLLSAERAASWILSTGAEMIESDSQPILSPTVAIIDDDIVQLKLYKSQLTSLGANVTTFESGGVFLEHQDAMWDLIVVRELPVRAI